jgi:hypothetical protein
MNKNKNKNNNNNGNNKCEIPCVAPTPVSEPFMFEVADQIILEKDRTIALLQEELVELKEFMTEQRRQKIARDTFMRTLASAVEDIVELFPSFKNKPIDAQEYRAIYATVKGNEWVQTIVEYVDKFKGSLQILRLLQTEVLQVKIENVTYKSTGSPGSTPQIMCTTKSSIIGFENTVINGLSDNPFSMLKHRMEYALIELIKFGKGVHPNAVWYAHKEAEDGINYSSNEEHAQIWEHKKAFSSRLLNATAAYVESLIQNHY